MITLQISGRHFELDDKIRAYVDKKIGELDKFLPKHKEPLTGSVVLAKDNSNHQNNEYFCEVILHIPGERMLATESTVNMYAAIDIVEQKLKQQVLRYKDKHEPARNRRQKMFGKLFMRDKATNPGLADESDAPA